MTDAFAIGDIFEIFDSGASIGSTSTVSTGGSCGSDPEVCVTEDPLASYSAFYLGAGLHEITIQAISSPYGGGAAYFRIDSGPEPLTQIGMKGILLFRNIQEDRFQFKLTNVTDIAARAKKAVEDDLTLTFQFGTATDPIYTLSVLSNDPNLDVGGNRMVWNDPDTGNLVRCIFSTEECVVSIKGDLDVYGEPVDDIINGEMEVILSVGGMNYTNTSYWNQYDSGSGPWTEGGNWSKFRNY
ncbi:MAG: hypothetical protein D3904_02610 [Candidatus Electrothrix sp. EH2]|nr:hypothetical protein [Candidatus Electrothrix sp. EH2]